MADLSPTIPDWANDKHTIVGKKLRRGIEHFREEGAKLTTSTRTKPTGCGRSDFLGLIASFALGSTLLTMSPVAEGRHRRTHQAALPDQGYD
jgi:hypothetical protein